MGNNRTNQLGLTYAQLEKVVKQLEGVESPDRFPMSPELSRLIGQFEGLIESLGNTLTVVRDDGVEVTYTRRLSQQDTRSTRKPTKSDLKNATTEATQERKDS